MAGTKETPRQKMIGMMYLVLTCLVALNVSKDILKGFVTVNESLEKTNKSMQTSNEQMLEAFKDAAEKTASAKGYYLKAVESRKLTTVTIAYIEELKKKLIEITESIDKKVADTMRLRFADKMDNYDIPTYQLIGDDETNPASKPYSARELKSKMEELHRNLVNLVDGMQNSKDAMLPASDYKSIKTKIDILKPVDTGEMEGDLKVTWEIQNFYHLPLAAVITNLSKIESDIKNVETEMINQFAAASGKLVIKIDKFAAKVVAPSKYIRSGESFSADIFLAGSSSDFNNENMQVLIGAKYDTATKQLLEPGTPLNLMGGMGKYLVPTSGQGEQTISGVIKMRNGKGITEYFPFEDKYTVAAPVSAVSADEMNVFYTGIDNKVTISAAGVAPKDLVVKVNGHNAPLVSIGSGKYQIKPTSTGTCEVAVYAKDSNGQLKLQGAPSKFRLRELPTPFVKINGKYAVGTLDMKKLEIGSFNTIVADIPGFEYNAKYKIISFTVGTTGRGGDSFDEVACNSSALTLQAKTNVAKVRVGGRIFIENILAEGPDKKIRKLPDVIIKVKS